MATKRLGRGLDALFGADDMFDFLSEESREREPSKIPLAQIEPSAEQPRKRFEKEALGELANSIRMHGVISPIAVRKVENGTYRIIAGERRWRAARLAGLKEIPAVILDASEQSAMEMALIENLQRENLNPVEEARGFQSLIERYSLTQEEVAEKVGRSRPAVANSLRLLGLPEGVLSMLETGKISNGHARAILALEGDELRNEAAERIAKESLSVRQTEQMVKRLMRPPSSKGEEHPANKINYLESIEQDLTAKCGRRVRIVDGRDKGKIELEYYGSDDFERLIGALSSLAI